MYIIDYGKKDYYDGVVGSVGLDKTIIYKRETIEIYDDKDKPNVFNVKSNTWRTDNPFIKICRSKIDEKKTKKYDDVFGFVIGFCGKLYVGWEFTYTEKNWGDVLPLPKSDFIYDYDVAKKMLRESLWDGNLDDSVRYIMDFDPINQFREINSPIFHLVRGKRNSTILTINPILANYEFYKIIDSFAAFNEIESYISGVLGVGENKMIEIDDKHKILKHGFDYKWSFRKKSKRKNN